MMMVWCESERSALQGMRFGARVTRGGRKEEKEGRKW